MAKCVVTLCGRYSFPWLRPTLGVYLLFDSQVLLTVMSRRGIELDGTRLAGRVYSIGGVRVSSSRAVKVAGEVGGGKLVRYYDTSFNCRC